MNINVGEKIKELRTAKNITQSELAEKIGVTTSAVSSYEISGRQPSYDVLIKIARLFNVTTDFLLGLGCKDIIDITGLSIKQRNIISETIIEFKNSIRYPTSEELKEFDEIIQSEFRKYGRVKGWMTNQEIEEYRKGQK